METVPLTLLLVAFVYLGEIPFGFVVYALLRSRGATETPREHLRRTILPVILAGLIFGVLIGFIAAVVAAHPVVGAGFAFTGNGILGFPQLVGASVLASLVATGIRQAWGAMIIVPISLIGAFALSWWGFGMLFPPMS